MERGAKSRSGLAGGHGVLVGDGALGEGLAGAVLDADHQTEIGEFGQQGRHAGPELGLVDQCHQVRIGKQVPELLFHVAEVDVDPYRTELEDRPCRLHPLHAVQGVDADMVAGPDPLVGEEVGQSVGPFLHFGVGAPLAGGHEVLPVAEGVHGRLEEISEVERHRAVSRTRFHSGGKRRTARHRAVSDSTQMDGMVALSPLPTGVTPVPRC